MSNKLEIIYRPIGNLTLYSGNARVHSKEQVRQIARSVESFGFINPVLVDENDGVVAGHGRLAAAREIGLKHIPTIRVDHLSSAQLRAYRLADNKIAENAGWDPDLLRVEIEYLTSLEIDFDVDITGFSTTEVDLLIGNDRVPPSDDAIIPPPDPAEAVSRLGDLWYLGPHRVICGDCRDRYTIDRLLDGVQASMLLTDSPYNVKIAGNVGGLGKHQHREFSIAYGELTSDEFTQFLKDALKQLARVCVDGALAYLFMDWRHLGELLSAGTSVFDRLLNVCVWVKNNGGMGSLYRSQHEFVFVFKKGTAPHQNNVELGKNGRYRTNVWHYTGVNSFGAERDEALSWHPTVKPVQLLADAILDVTRRGDIVLDGFLGSGSCLISAERTGRICYGVELDPGYVDVTLDRWERISGERATLGGTDLDIDQLAAERGIRREMAA